MDFGLGDLGVFTKEAKAAFAVLGLLKQARELQHRRETSILKLASILKTGANPSVLGRAGPALSRMARPSAVPRASLAAPLHPAPIPTARVAPPLNTSFTTTPPAPTGITANVPGTRNPAALNLAAQGEYPSIQMREGLGSWLGRHPGTVGAVGAGGILATGAGIRYGGEAMHNYFNPPPAQLAAPPPPAPGWDEIRRRMLQNRAQGPDLGQQWNAAPEEHRMIWQGWIPPEQRPQNILQLLGQAGGDAWGAINAMPANQRPF